MHYSHPLMPQAQGKALHYACHSRQTGRHRHPARLIAPWKNYEAISKLMEASPKNWGGAYVDGDVLVIKYVGVTEGEAETAGAEAGVIGAVRYVPGTNSLAKLEQAKSAISKTMALGSGVVGVGPNYVTGGLDVEATSADPTILQTIESLVPDSAIPVEVHDVGGNIPVPSGTRYYDTRAYWGGNAVELSGGGEYWSCSTGFNLTGAGDGYQYALTAAHCYTDSSGPPHPSVAIRRSGPTSSKSDDTTSGMGTVNSVSVYASGPYAGRKGDIAVYRYTPVPGISVEGHGGPFVYHGDGNVTAGKAIVGTVDLPVGYKSGYIRTSGASGWYLWASTGMISPDWVRIVNHDVYYSSLGLTYPDLTVVEDVEECTSVGDSGGAVYLLVSGGAKAVGVISGTNNSGSGPTNCRNYYSPVKFLWTTATIRLA